MSFPTSIAYMFLSVEISYRRSSYSTYPVPTLYKWIKTINRETVHNTGNHARSRQTIINLRIAVINNIKIGNLKLKYSSDNSFIESQ